MSLAINATDSIARAYGRRLPKYPVRPETVGLGVLLLANRNTAQDRPLWLSNNVVSDAVCVLAETFAEAATGGKALAGWRGGALASLRTLAGSHLHEEDAVPPWSGERGAVHRLWVEDDGTSTREPSPFRADVVQRARDMAGGDASAAFDAMREAWEHARLPGDASYLTPRLALAGFGCGNESPHQSRWLARELAGEDPWAEREAERQRQVDEWLQSHPQEG